MEPNQKDEYFHQPAEEANETGSRSELLLHTLERDKNADDSPVLLREAKDIQIEPKIRPGFLGKRGNSKVKEHRLSFQRQDERQAFNKHSGRYLKENKLVPSSCFVGLHSTSLSRAYPGEEGIAVFLRGMCCQLKTRLIGDGGGVVTYEGTPPEGDELLPIVKCFYKNMEDEVPKELIKLD